MEIILTALLSMCFGNQVCEDQMRDCMAPRLRHYEGKKLYSSINFAILESCYWGKYIPQDFKPGDKLPIGYHTTKNDLGND